MRKGFFGFFKGLNKEMTEEEQRQHDHAKAQERRVIDSDIKDESNSSSNIAITDNMAEYIRSRLDQLFVLAGYKCDVKINRIVDDRLYLEIDSDEDMGRIIGRDGAHLDAVQTLARAFAYQEYSLSIRVSVEAGGYRRKRRHAVRAKATAAAKKVIKTGRSVSLEPMSSGERRMVHVMFENDDRITTSSEGSNNERYVVLSVKS